MDDIYTKLQSEIGRLKRVPGPFEIRDASAGEGFDPFLGAAKVAGQKKVTHIRVASLRDLVGFTRVSNDLLVHKSDQDFWRITKDADGSHIIERLVDSDVLGG